MGPASAILVLREFDSAAIAAQWDSGKPAVGHREVALIEDLQRRAGKQFFELGHRSIRATQWVGSVGIGNKTIDVVPKTDVVDDDQRKGARANLLHMLCRAGVVSVSSADTAAMLATGKPLITAFMEVYVRRLTDQWRRGPIRRYVAHAENRPYLKGRLNVTENERLNHVHRQRFYTTSDEFTEDNLVSQVLKAALVCCREQSLDQQVVRLADGLLMDFEGVGTVYDVDGWWSGVVVDRTLLRFSEILRLAKAILGLQSPERDQAGRRCFTLMFDMNEVFERFIAAEMRPALRGTDLTVKTQVGGQSLLIRNGRQQFQLRPDIGVFRGNQLVTLLDTKWKRLDPDKAHNGVAQADMYQMYAYGKEYGVDRTVLVYPRHSDMRTSMASYEHQVPSGSTLPARRVEVTTVDISVPLSSREAVRQLRNDLLWVARGELSTG